MYINHCFPILFIQLFKTVLVVQWILNQLESSTNLQYCNFAIYFFSIVTHFIITHHIFLVRVQTYYCNKNLLILDVKQLNKIMKLYDLKHCGMARITLKYIMGCPGLKSSYQEKGLLEVILATHGHIVSFFEHSSHLHLLAQYFQVKFNNFKILLSELKFVSISQFVCEFISKQLFISAYFFILIQWFHYAKLPYLWIIYIGC